MVMAQGRIDLRSSSRAEITRYEKTSIQAVFSYSSIESIEVPTEKGVFSEIALPGTYPSGEMGTPELPAFHELIAVPFGAEPIVTITNYSTTDYKLADYGIHTIVPHQPSVRKDQNMDELEFVYDAASYQMRGLATSPAASIEVQGTMRGVQVGSLLVNPVSYDAVSNTLRVFNDIEVSVDFVGADLVTTEQMLVNTYSPYFDIVYKQFFNYRQINDVYTDHPDLMAYPVHMIVIAPENYLSTLQPWTDWKVQKGFDVNVYTTAQAGSNYNAIRTFVQNLYNTGVSNGATPTFLILVGDVAQVPNTTGNQSQKVTDLYYGSVDNDDFPDMFYSRMSAENTNQLTAIINKVLQYEQYTMPDPSYLNNVTLIAGWDSNWNPRVGQPTINYATTYYYNAAHGFNEVHAHLNQSQYNGCYNALSTGIGFVNYTAHGDNTYWHEPRFAVNNVNQLTNTDKYFLAMGNCCLAANFGYSQPCLGEAMIRAENKGAFSYIGSCPSSYWYEDYYFAVGATNTFSQTPNINNTATGCYDGIWMDDTYNTVSSMIFLGNLAVCYAHAGNYSSSVSDKYYWQSYHVLGDGSIMPYRVNPTANSVSHMPTFPMNVATFAVTAEPGSYVGISKDNVLLGAALVPASGSVSVNVTPVTTTGNVRIVVTKPQRQPYVADIQTGNATDPCIQFVSCTPTSGNAGQTINLNAIVKNVGAATTGNTTVTLTTSDSNITILNGTASVGPLATNQVSSCTFSIQPLASTEDGHVAPMTVTSTYESNSWTGNFNFTVLNPCYAPSNLVTTPEGNSIHLTWTASSTAASYRIFRASTLIANNITTTSYTDENLAYSHMYCYTVKANCTNGELSDPSNQSCSITEAEPLPCDPPTNVTVEHSMILDVTVSWEASENATAYKVFRNDALIVDGFPYLSYHDEDLPYGEHCYYVEAICENGVSEPSNEACITIEIPCDPATNFLASYVYTQEDDFGVQLSWTVNASLMPEFCSLYRSNDGANYEKIAEVQPSKGLNYNYFDDVEVGSYSYLVTVQYMADNHTCVSDPAYASVEVTGVTENTAITNLYPNPANDKLHIEANAEMKEVNVYSMMGSLVRSFKDCGQATVITLDDMSKGIYFIQVVTNDSTEIRRFVKE